MNRLVESYSLTQIATDVPRAATTVAVLLALTLLFRIVAKVRRRSEESRPDGLQVISDLDNPTFEIIAVHGLGAHPEYTWTYRAPTKSAGSANSRRTHLLRDLLKADFPNARILSFAHNSDWLIDAPVKTAQQIGDRLLDQLAKHRSSRPHIPIIFIGHSFGGIIIKEALCKPGDISEDIVDDTHGIFFLGTPHLGSPVSLVGAAAAFLTGFLGSNTTLLLALRNHHGQLSDIEDRFIQRLKEKESRWKKTDIVSFNETKPTYLLGWLSIGLIVTRDSARGGHSPRTVDIDTDHSGLNKCRQGDVLHRTLTEELTRLSVADKPTLNRAQLFVVDRLDPLDDATFDSYAERHGERCLPGTRVDLLREIDEWADNPGREHIYWLQGMAGTGKSTISRTVAHKLDQSLSGGSSRLGASFFFKRGEGDRNNARGLFTTIAAGLVRRAPLAAEHVRKAVEREPRIAAKSIGEQFKALLLEPFQAIPALPQRSPETLVVVIDALDECASEADVQCIIRLLAQAKDITSVCLKFFLTSRPELSVRLGFQEISGSYDSLALHKIPDPVIEHDISAFLRFRLSQIREQFFPISPKDWPDESSVQRLVKMAIPLFIFASTACRFIEDTRRGGGGPDERLRKILEYETKGDLNQTYLPVLNQMVYGLEEEARCEAMEEFKKVVGSIVTLASPLPSKSLARLLDVPTALVTERLSLLHSVLDIPHDLTAPVKLLHLSFRDFLLDRKNRAAYPFWVDSQKIHEWLADRCLELLSTGNNLRRDICGLHGPGTPRSEISPRIISGALPPDVQYACRYWVHHWKESKREIRDGDLIDHFLSNHLLHWLEALSITGKIRGSIDMVDDLQGLLHPEESTTISALLHDVRRVLLQHCSIIDTSPLQVYSSAVIFAPEKSITRKMYRDHVLTWIPLLPQVDLDWNTCSAMFEGHTNFVCSVAFSPDGRQLASGSDDMTVKLWEAATGECVATFKGYTDGVRSVAFSHDGRQLASGCDDSTIRLWDIATGICVAKFKGHRDYVRSVAFSHDGRQLASGSQDETVKLWDVASGKCVASFETYDANDNSVAFSPDSQQLASGSEYNVVKLWNIASGQCVATFWGHSDKIHSISFSHDGRQLASGSDDKTVKLWDVAIGTCIATFWGHSEYVRSVAFSPDGRQLASGSGDKTVKLWNTATGECMATFKEHSGFVHSVAFSPDGHQLASASEDKTVGLWNVVIGAGMATFDGHGDYVRSISFSPDDRQLASGSDDKTVKLWDTATGACVATFKGHTKSVCSVAFSPDGRQLASGSDDMTVKLWDAATGECVATFKGHSYYVRSVAFSHDGRQLVSGSDAVRLWNTATGKCVATFEGHPSGVYSVAFSPDGRQIASASYYPTITLWDAATGACVATFRGHTYAAYSIAFSPDGRWLASASYDTTVRLWDAATGAGVAMFMGFKSKANSAVAFSSNSRQLRTKIGTIPLDWLSASTYGIQLQNRVQGYGFSSDNAWITDDAKNQLWLPPRYRPTTLAIADSIVALGCTSGRVLVLKFTEI